MNLVVLVLGKAGALSGSVRESTDARELVSLLEQLAAAPAAGAAPEPRAELPSEGLDLKAHLERIEVRLISQALRRANGVIAHAATTLGLRRTTLVEKLRKYGLQRDDVVAGDDAPPSSASSH